MTQVHHEITGITIPVCMVPARQLALCIATFAELTTRVLYIVISELVALQITALCMATGLELHIMVVTIPEFSLS